MVIVGDCRASDWCRSRGSRAVCTVWLPISLFLLDGDVGIRVGVAGGIARRIFRRTCFFHVLLFRLFFLLLFVLCFLVDVLVGFFIVLGNEIGAFYGDVEINIRK